MFIDYQNLLTFIGMTEENVRRQLQGFLAMPSLFLNESVFNKSNFETFPIHTAFEASVIPEKLRLGLRVEYFFEHFVENHPDLVLLAKNIQVKRQKQTIGELDFLLKDIRSRKNIHVELVCKFYFYDPDSDTGGLTGWMGANRKDQLHKKVERLQGHQFPLLRLPETQHTLNTLHILPLSGKDEPNYTFNAEEFEQQLCFKAQLYTPRPFDTHTISQINPDALAGHYYRPEDLQNSYYQSCRYFIPTKYDWVSVPHIEVPFTLHSDAFAKIRYFLENQYAPMIWILHKNGSIERAFVVWW